MARPSKVAVAKARKAVACGPELGTITGLFASCSATGWREARARPWGTALADQQRNVFGEPIEVCSLNPTTGFYRSGCCETGPEDVGVHTVCVEVTKEFLAFSKARGNDLSTPRPEYGFPGLNPGDRWCLCAERWQEALAAGVAPRVVLAATHEATLEIAELTDLKRHALDLA
jgi:hypothetical protein